MDGGRMDLSVILPTYNERKNIVKVITDLDAFFKSEKLETELIVVDDSSPDGTADEVRKLQQKYLNLVLVADHPKQGIGKALERGYDAARGDWLLSMDADWAFETGEIKRFLDAREKGFDFITGSKYLALSVYKKKTLELQIKSSISKYGMKYIRFVSGLSLNDFSSNFRLFRKEVWRAIRPSDPQNFFLVEMLIQAHRKGFKITEVPVTLSPRHHGESKTRVWDQTVKFFLKTTAYLFSRK